MNFNVTLEMIAKARTRTSGMFSRTSLQRLVWLERELGANYEIWLKREDTQAIGAYKVRGAASLITHLIEASNTRIDRFFARSSGNHGLGCAYVCKMLGYPCTVVLPDSAPTIKVTGIRDLFGASILTFNLNDTGGTGYVPGDRQLQTLRANAGWKYIHPYAELATMAGTGVIGLEILEDLPKVTHVIGQVSGGGLFAGICAGIQQTKPDVEMIAVEPEGADDFKRSLIAGSIQSLTRPTSIADGMLSHDVGKDNWAILKQCVAQNNALTVSDQEIWLAMHLLYKTHGIISEPSGAAALATLTSNKFKPASGSTVVAILSGANVDRKVFEESLKAGSWQGNTH